jgi:hypothetical protein
MSKQNQSQRKAIRNVLKKFNVKLYNVQLLNAIFEEGQKAERERIQNKLAHGILPKYTIMRGSTIIKVSDIIKQINSTEKEK